LFLSLYLVKSEYAVAKRIVWLSLSVLVITHGGVGYAQNGAERARHSTLPTAWAAMMIKEKGDGDGAAASALPVKLANLTDGTVMNELPDKFLVEIISKGGGRSASPPSCPHWEINLMRSNCGI